MSKDDGGPAFPRLDELINTSRGFMAESSDGMSLRDYFAAAALQGLLSALKPRAEDNVSERDGTPITHAAAQLPRIAYGYADAMLAERSKP